MKIGNSVKKLCNFCKIFYRFGRLQRICKIRKHHKRQR